MVLGQGKPTTAYEIAERYLGTREVAGSGSNPEILGWLLRAGATWATDDAESWCSAFVYHPAWELGLPTPHGFDRLRARHWLAVGQPVELERAVRGFDVVILRRGSGPQPGPSVLDAQGHVGWFDSIPEPGLVRILGGNQGARGEVSLANAPATHVLGVRRLWSPE